MRAHFSSYLPERIGTRPGGFTLIEIVVVMVLVSVMLLVGLLNVNFLGWRLDAAATQVAQRARVARTVAVMRQHDVILDFDVDGRSVVMHEDLNNNGLVEADERVLRYGLEDGTEYALGAAPTYESYEPGPVTFADGRVTFYRNGSASQEGAVYIGAENEESKVRAVVISRATGYSRVLHFTGSRWLTP